MRESFGKAEFVPYVLTISKDISCCIFFPRKQPSFLAPWGFLSFNHDFIIYAFLKPCFRNNLRPDLVGGNKVNEEKQGKV